MRVRSNSEDIGRCGCGRRIYCDGSHGLTETEWQALRAKELAAAKHVDTTTAVAEREGQTTPRVAR